MLARKIILGFGFAVVLPLLVHWLVDQVDSLLGALACMCLVWVPPLAVAALLAAITLVAHPAMGLVMVGLGLKRRVG